MKPGELELFTRIARDAFELDVERPKKKRAPFCSECRHAIAFAPRRGRPPTTCEGKCRLARRARLLRERRRRFARRSGHPARNYASEQLQQRFEDSRVEREPDSLLEGRTR